MGVREIVAAYAGINELLVRNVRCSCSFVYTRYTRYETLYSTVLGTVHMHIAYMYRTTIQ